MKKLILILIFIYGCSASKQSIQETHLLAADFYKNRQDAKAVELWQEVVSQDPSHVEAWQNIAVVQEQSFKDVNAAIKTLEEAHEENPENTEISAYLAKLLQQAGRTEESKNLINSAIKTNPSDANSLNTKALSCFAGSDFKCALENLLKVKQLDPNFNGINFNLGLAYERAGQPEIAVQHFIQETKVSPLNSEAYAKAGDCYNAIQKNDLAIEYYKKAIKIEPNLAWPHYNIAVLIESKNQDAAIMHYNNFLKLAPTNPDALSNLALIYLERKKTAKALELLQKAVQHGNSPHFHYNLGLAWLNTGCELNAYKEYKTALDANPNLNPARNAIARLASKHSYQVNSSSEISAEDLNKLAKTDSKSCKK